MFRQRTLSQLNSGYASACSSRFNIGNASFVSQVPIQKYKDQDTKNCNFARCFVSVWKSVSQMDEHRPVTEEWRRLRNEELYDLYSSLNIIWVIK
jgi:hypothetical protein